MRSFCSHLLPWAVVSQYALGFYHQPCLQNWAHVRSVTVFSWLVPIKPQLLHWPWFFISFWRAAVQIQVGPAADWLVWLCPEAVSICSSFLPKQLVGIGKWWRSACARVIWWLVHRTNWNPLYVLSWAPQLCLPWREWDCHWWFDLGLHHSYLVRLYILSSIY